MATIASTGKVTLPAYIEVGSQLVHVGDVEVAVDIRAVRFEGDREDEIGRRLHAVLDLSVED
ncbi:hypothetical protein MHY85_03130 [Cellulomonas sp. ACRRI]|uniref:hypothetical protein n=1 Tax=Cellulomonas sp. ACRRI TaxID=2918188 RepID=UPI001EF18746|nr:hypothetical protein [Cellulomonas sp. ACRRI]MCG7284965.1 hypothetical protein [Cellulomonas sp. ACRRI]